MEDEYLHTNGELESLSPLLAKIQKTNIQDIPQGYFDQVENQILSQLAILKIDKQPQTDIPKEYFKTLEDNIVKRLNLSPSQNKVTLKNILSHRFTKVAAMAVFVMGAIFLYRLERSVDKIDMALNNDWNETELWDYLIEDSDEVSLNTLIDNGLVEDGDLIVLSDSDYY